MTFVSVLGAVCLIAASGALAQDWTDAPYGPEDMAGASNLMSATKTLEAIDQIWRGNVISMGRPYVPEMPMAGGQIFELQNRAEGGDGQAVLVESYLSLGGGAVGTHLDGLAHFGAGGDAPEFYNGVSAADVMAEAGAARLGIEHVRPIFARGILIDMVSLRGGAMQAGDEITVADLEAALERQLTAPPKPGDVVVLHTGWGRHWIADNETYLSGAPGIGIEAARWLAERQVSVVAADSWAVEVVAGIEGAPRLPVHAELIPKHGILLHKNLATERLIDAEITEFAYIFAPVPIAGAAGSIGAPLAVY